MTMVDVGTILIVGGGIAALTVARALRRHDFAVEIVERSPSWQTVGAGLSLQANGMRVFRDLGLAASIEKRGCPLSTMSIHGAAGEALSCVDLADVWRGVGPCIGIARAALHDVLVTAIEDVPRRLGVAVISVEPRADSTVVRFDDGTIRPYGLVVAADGIGSALRGTSPTYGGQMVWRALVPIRPRELTGVVFAIGDGRFFGMCPVGEHTTYVFANVSGPFFHDPIEGRRERVRDRFRSFGGELVEGLLDALPDDDRLHCSAIEWLDDQDWGERRVVLIGDAAHATSPMLGQGASLAAEDALVLAEELAARDDADSAIAAFVARRRARVAWVHAESRRAAQVFGLAPAIRDAMLRERGNATLRARYEPLRAPP
jgi:2-polyprenyl-6-methoxyphenol hydroxylase-like FAD-dependent oxidoreductase